MIGLVIITHGKLGVEMLNAMEQIIGRQENIEPFVWEPDDCLVDKMNKLKAVVDSVDTGDGVFAMTDMKGGNPSTMCISAMDSGWLFDFIAGINLPMLLKFVEMREQLEMTGLVESCRQGGENGVCVHAFDETEKSVDSD